MLRLRPALLALLLVAVSAYGARRSLQAAPTGTQLHGLHGAASLPSPNSLTAARLSRELVASFTELNGAGTLYAACRDTSDPAVKVDRACDKGLQCCGYLGSAEGEKLSDTCVRNTGGSECPRMIPGAQGGPCGRGRQCAPGLVCCDARPLLEGLTSVLVPTCQHAGAVKDSDGVVLC